MRTTIATLAPTAARQRGRITHEQLVRAGVHPSTIKRWAIDGRLRREHVGVYALGHPDPSPAGLYHSAALAAGAGAVVSGAAAAHLVSVIASRRPPDPEVTIPTVTHRRRPGIVIHRVRFLHPLDVSTFEGVPITTLPRTLLDLAPRLSPQQLGRACHETWVRHSTGSDEILACIARNPHKPGAAKLRAALGADATLSVLEDRFLELLRRHGVPRPRTNVDRSGDKVDCHWPDRDLTIELVTFRYHATRHAFEEDVARRRRSNHLAYTYGDVVERGRRTAAEVAALLAASPTAAPARARSAGRAGRDRRGRRSGAA